MNWDALGAVGEIVGAAAVVLTLGYLSVRIRRNSKSSRQQSYNDLQLDGIGPYLASASMGISLIGHLVEEPSVGKLIQRAEQAMYRSKFEGRDRLTVFNPAIIVSNV